MECGVIRIENHGPQERKISKDWRLSRCGYGIEWRVSAGWNSGQMKRYYKKVEEKRSHSNNPKPTEKLVGPHNEGTPF